MSGLCSHVVSGVLSVCCGANAYYGFCSACHEHTGWEQVCLDCGEVLYDCVEEPSP